jgi:hypothetical protein
MAPVSADDYGSRFKDTLVHLALSPAGLSTRSVEDSLRPSDNQRTTLIVIGCYALFIAVAWNVWGLRCESESDGQGAS